MKYKDYTIRIANSYDSKELSHLKKNLLETTYRGIYPDTMIDDYNYEENIKLFRNIINNKDVILYIVEYNNSIIGYMSCGKRRTPFNDYAEEIGLLYIKKEHQGKGIGKTLFEIAYKNIESRGIKKFIIGCNKYNLKARAFYEKMGGVIINEDEDRPNDKSFVQVKFAYNIK